MYFFKVQKICLLLIFVIGGITSVLSAQQIQHKVQDEETLFSIAQKYEVSVQQLKKWNNLTGNAISIGQTLIIKPKKSEGTYTVKYNDTLFSIAQRFNVAVDELRKWNQLENSTLAVGTVLVVRSPKKQTDGIEKASTAAAIPANPDGYYTVKSGDTLFRIAQMHTMEVEQLKKLNNLTSSNIHVGQKLKVKAAGFVSPRIKSATAKPGAVIYYKLKRGMPVNDLLSKFRMDEAEFEQLNPEMKATYLNEGQIVKVVVPKTENEEAQTEKGLTVLGRTEAFRYSAALAGTTTTNGELYNPSALTAAHHSMAIGSVIFVKNPANNRGAIVRINDRITEKGLKLSKAAWQALDLSKSTGKVIIFRINE